MNEQLDLLALDDAATAGLKSMDHLIQFVSHKRQWNQTVQPDCRELLDVTVSSFKKVISILNRTSNARFRRSPVQVSDSCTAASSNDTMSLSTSFMPSFTGEGTVLKLLSSITGEGSVSNGKLLSSVTGEGSVSKLLSSITGEGSVYNGKLLSSITGEGSVSKLLSSITCEGSVYNGKLLSSIIGEGSVSNGKLLSSISLPFAGKRCRDQDNMTDELSSRISGSCKFHCKNSSEGVPRVSDSENHALQYESQGLSLDFTKPKVAANPMNCDTSSSSTTEPPTDSSSSSMSTSIKSDNGAVLGPWWELVPNRN